MDEPLHKTVQTFPSRNLGTLLKLLRLKEQHRASHDPILRKTTALLFFHTPPSCHFGCEDASPACQNASLMAQSPGVSQIVMGYIIHTIRNDKRGVFLQITGIDGKIQAIMAPGIPAFHYPRYTDRQAEKYLYLHTRPDRNRPVQ